MPENKPCRVTCWLPPNNPHESHLQEIDHTFSQPRLQAIVKHQALGVCICCRSSSKIFPHCFHLALEMAPTSYTVLRNVQRVDSSWAGLREQSAVSEWLARGAQRKNKAWPCLYLLSLPSFKPTFTISSHSYFSPQETVLFKILHLYLTCIEWPSTMCQH